MDTHLIIPSFCLRMPIHTWRLRVTSLEYPLFRSQMIPLGWKAPLLQSRGTQVLQGLKDDQKTRYNGDGDFIKPLPCHRLQNMHKYP